MGHGRARCPRGYDLYGEILSALTSRLRSLVRNIIIIGAAKSGTSSLCYDFKHHHEVTISVPKETNYFSSIERQRLCLSDYLDFWKQRCRRSVLLEASPSYSIGDSSETARKIRTLVPDAKLVYIIRDPIERLESHFNFGVRRFSWNYTGNMLLPQLLDASDYKKHIRNYRAEFDDSALLVISFNELLSMPLKVIKRICSFGQIEPDFTPPEIRHLAKTGTITRMEHWDRHFRTRLLGRFHRLLFNDTVQRVFSMKRPLPRRVLTEKDTEILLNQQKDVIFWLLLRQYKRRHQAA